MKKKCFDWEQSFAFIWNSADNDGLWGGDDATVAEEFNVSEDEAHDILGELCTRGHVEKLYPGRYAIVRWREPDDPAEQELRWWEIHG
jgi:predicted transcriptional regulator of viral defense system